jgi:hypothetical protein
MPLTDMLRSFSKDQSASTVPSAVALALATEEVGVRSKCNRENDLPTSCAATMTRPQRRISRVGDCPQALTEFRRAARGYHERLKSRLFLDTVATVWMTIKR